jgi:hypothetical protein
LHDITLMSQVIKIPTLNDRIQDFERLFSLHQQAIGCEEDLILDFSGCNFLRHNAVAFIGGLVRTLQHKGRSVKIEWNSIPDKISANLEQNGFHTALTGNKEGRSGNSIPYREDSTQDSDGFVSYLSNYWLGRGWVEISEDLKTEIITKIAEIYENAFEHAESEVGIFTCGQRYPNLSELNLTIVDFGIGIPQRVRTLSTNTNLSDLDAIQWAIARGNSTRTGCVAGGGGLDTLRHFVTQHNGKMEIISHNGYILLTKDGIICNYCSSCFVGTLININLNCDESHYYKKPHRSDKLWF